MFTWELVASALEKGRSMQVLSPPAGSGSCLQVLLQLDGCVYPACKGRVLYRQTLHRLEDHGLHEAQHGLEPAQMGHQLCDVQRSSH